MIHNSINNCPIDSRKKLYGSIVLSGSNTLFPGFSTRLENKIKSIYKRV